MGAHSGGYRGERRTKAVELSGGSWGLCIEECPVKTQEKKNQVQGSFLVVQAESKSRDHVG